MRALLLWGVLVLVTFTGGCGSGDAAGPPAQIGGQWTGTWLSTPTGRTGTLATDIRQNGSTISGSIQVGSSPCLLAAAVSGLVNGQAIQFQAQSGPDRMSFTATIQMAAAGSMIGSYSVTEGNCAGDVGTFDLTKS